MKKLLAIFGVVAAAVVLATVSAGAASGDAVIVRSSDVVALTAPQKTCWVNWIGPIWPSAVPAQLTSLTFKKRGNAWFADLREKRTLTGAELIALESNGSKVDIDSVGASFPLGVIELTPGEAAGAKACAEGEHAGANFSVATGLELLREGNIVTSQLFYVDTVDPDTYLSLRQSGAALKLLSVVP